MTAAPYFRCPSLVVQHSAYNRFGPTSQVTRPPTCRLPQSRIRCYGLIHIVPFGALLLQVVLLALSTAVPARAHGCIGYPRPRGGQGDLRFINNAPVCPNARRDFRIHFPAGKKAPIPGTGIRSQIRAGRQNWTPFLPLKAGLVWRSGVCGDDKFGRRDHEKGGRYFNGGRVSATFISGSVIALKVSIVAHHNGFMEFHVCDVAKCGGRISEKCFRMGACSQLLRADNPICDSGLSKSCGPKDRHYPGRWYLPCATVGKGKWDIYGMQNTMLYHLPENLTCRRCVLHWYWTSANSCNPPGYIRYFTDVDRPKKWGRCEGQGGAIGGYAWRQRRCGGRRFPEEYYQCADIRIVENPGQMGMGGCNHGGVLDRGVNMSKIRSSNNFVNGQETMKHNPLQKLLIRVRTGSRKEWTTLTSATDGESVKLEIGKYKGINFLLKAEATVTNVEFYLDFGAHRQVLGSQTKPFYAFGLYKWYPKIWKTPLLHRWFTIVARSGNHFISTKFFLCRYKCPQV